MTFTDIILTIIIIIILCGSGYFCFVKDRKNSCGGCPFAKNCENKSTCKKNKSKCKKR